MNLFKKLFKYSFYLIASIVLYALLSILISYIIVNKDSDKAEDSETIYLHTNGVHTSVILPVIYMSEELKKDMILPDKHKYAKFGWGDRNFYLNIPTWADFKIKYALGAFFLDNPTLMQVTTYNNQRQDWIPVKVNKEEVIKMNNYLEASFKNGAKKNKTVIAQTIYSSNNTFYLANGSYSPIKTCNTWVNNGFKESGLKASLWTLFDFGIINKYKK